MHGSGCIDKFFIRHSDSFEDYLLWAFTTFGMYYFVLDGKDILINKKNKAMNVTNPDLVLVRGINSDWFKENFSQLWIGFGGTPKATPNEDAFYVGLYMGAPISAITHIGIVESIERYDNGADFYLKAIIKLQNPVSPGHAIRKHENWTLSQLGLGMSQMDIIRNQLLTI